MESLALKQPSKERTRSTTTSRETETETSVTTREGLRGRGGRSLKLTVGSGAVQEGGGEDEGAEEGDPGIHPLRSPRRCLPACRNSSTCH